MKTYIQLISVCLVVLGATDPTRVVAQAPTVQVLSPTPGSTVATLSQIAVSFSEPVTGLEAHDLLINGEPAADVEVSGGTVYTFTCTAPLPGFVSVYFDVDHGITDLTGNAFNEIAPGASASLRS